MRRRLRVFPLVAMVAATLWSSSDERAVRNERGMGTVRTYANRRGRPRKFSRPARAVTLTLPEDTIAALKSIDSDISRAVVRAVGAQTDDTTRPPAELVTFGKRAVIVVTPTQAIRDRTGAELVPLPDGRALVAFGGDLTASQFELRLQDALSDDTLCAKDRETFESIVGIMRESRQRTGTGIPERTIMVLQA